MPNDAARIKLGDSLDVLQRDVLDASVQLVITSPPYADARKSTYGGLPPDEYTEWFLPYCQEIQRVLQPTGTFILNIKENVVNGVRHRYVRDILDGLEKQGWLFTEEWIWDKTNTMPGKWPNRFRDEWEHLFQFNKQRKFDMYQDEVMQPIGDWAKTRLKTLRGSDLVRHSSKTKSGFGRNLTKWKDRVLAYPSNVLSLAPECGNKKHSAAFPLRLPEFFIRLFTKPQDIVLDPFAGSGTTGVAAVSLFRQYIGIDKEEENVKRGEQRLINEVDDRQKLHIKEKQEQDALVAKLLGDRNTIIIDTTVAPEEEAPVDIFDLMDELSRD